jgi:uncharacterized membrane protein YhaH (DUF805 family)
MFYVMILVGFGVMWAAGVRTGKGEPGSMMLYVWAWVWIMSMISVFVRRARDVGQSPWVGVLAFIFAPLGWVILGSVRGRKDAVEAT